MSNRAVYTAIFGDYDTIKPYPKQNEDVDFFCFTDNKDMKCDGWTIIHSEKHQDDPRLDAKYYKMFPHKVLPQYEQTIWSDGAFHIFNPNFSVEVFSYISNNSIALFSHDQRNCIYKEAEFCKDMRKYKNYHIMDQVNFYKNNGYPENNGLYCGGLIARNNKDQKIQMLGERWWEEILKWTIQDQLSLPVILKELNISPTIFGCGINTNPWGAWAVHKNHHIKREYERI